MSKLYGQNTKNNVYKDKGGENDRKDEINDDNKVLIAIRPENIIFSKEKFQSSARNQLKGKIIDLIKNGPNILVKVDVNKVIIQGLLTANSADVLEMEVNNEVYLSFKSLNVKIIDKYHSFEL